MKESRRKLNGHKLFVLDVRELSEVRGGRYVIVGVNEKTKLAYLDDAGYDNKADVVRMIRIAEVVQKAKAEGTA